MIFLSDKLFEIMIIDGKKIAQKVLAETRGKISKLKEKGIIPGLAVVLVGEDPASKIYVSAKVRKCQDLGLFSQKIKLPTETTQKELIDILGELNENNNIHGILVQSPLPSHINEHEVFRAIDPAKDVDGFHPANLAKLVLEDPSGFVPCTPAGCLRLLKEAGVKTEGANVLVIGRSMIVGKPLALLMMNKIHNATVSVAHSKTKNLTDMCKFADVIITAIGKPEFIKADMIKEGAVILDVGITKIDDPSSKSSYRLVGDVYYKQVSSKCSAITPVPGGVGPMTIAMLISNTIKAATQSS